MGSFSATADELPDESAMADYSVDVKVQTKPAGKRKQEARKVVAFKKRLSEAMV
jgi:hypothetical protein